MGERILLIDDDPQVVRIVPLFLHDRGYDVEYAMLSEEGLDKAKSGEFDLILLDVGMPDIDGYEVCRQLRADPLTADLPIVMFTSAKRGQDRVEAFSAGADDFITKPVTGQELIARVQSILLRKRRSAAPAKKGKVIGVVGAKGGVGATTAAANIAVGLAEGAEHRPSVVLVELRSGQGTLAVELGLDRKMGLAELVAVEPKAVTEAAVGAQLQAHGASVQVLCGEVKPAGAAAGLTAEHALRVVERLQGVGEYVIADLGPGWETGTRDVLKEAHHVLVVLTPDAAAVDLAEALLTDIADSLSIEPERTTLLLMHREGAAPTVTKESLEQRLKRTVAASIPYQPQLAAEAAMRQKTMIGQSPTSIVAQQWRLVAEYVREL
jgi:DNA-binding response OmpR family regulator